MTEIDTYRRELRWLLAEVATSLEGVPPDRLRWRPRVADANDAATIVSHVLGATRAYVLGLGCGVPVGRDRDAEFAPGSASREVLLAALTALAGDVEAALVALDPGSLPLPIVRPADWRGPAPEGDRRGAIVEAIRHAGIHLGELRLTRLLAEA
jgi:DinB superfamily